MTHADDAARLAKKVEKDNPGAAGLIYAVLALADAQRADDGWHKIDDFDDLPVEAGELYIFKYANGSEAKWLLSADNRAGVYQFRSPHDRSIFKDQDDLVDECTHWRWA